MIDVKALFACEKAGTFRVHHIVLECTNTSGENSKLIETSYRLIKVLERYNE